MYGIDTSGSAGTGCTDRIARALRGGDTVERIAPAVRGLMEEGLAADLGELRIHTDSEASDLAAALEADAFTVGADVFFRRGAYNPGTADGLFLLAHEAAHAVQQATVPQVGRTHGLRISRPGDPTERAADRAAARIVRGGRVGSATPRVTVRRQADTAPMLVQRHGSWEHRLLGDAASADLNSIAQHLPNRTQVLTAVEGFLAMWRQNPDSITPEMIHARFPSIRTLRLKHSGLLVTYGELNTLPDYLANPPSMDDLPREVLLPILQAVRQEGFYNIARLMGVEVPFVLFEGAVSTHLSNGLLNDLWESIWLDKLTADLPPSGSPRQGTNSYYGLLARNACHFAPYSWYRWQQSYEMALQKAQEHHQTGSDDAKREAWIYLGYADHFLQDSFAAGHLINKTLVMQWFVEWAAGMPLERVPDWEQVKTMTAARQPGLAARGLYNTAAPGTVRDPQTAEEQESRQGRMDMSGVRADGPDSQPAAYQKYLTFLNNSVIQASSLALHDYLNGTGVYAASRDQAAPFQLFGDGTMLNGGDGVRIASDTAHMSQQSIQDVLDTGKTAISLDRIRGRFPTAVRAESGAMLPLEQWNESLRQRATQEFGNVHDVIIGTLNPHVGHVSIDQGGTPMMGKFRIKLSHKGMQGYLGSNDQHWAQLVDKDSAITLKMRYHGNGVFYGTTDDWWMSVGTALGRRGYVGFYYWNNAGPATWVYDPVNKRLTSGVNGAAMSLRSSDSSIYCWPDYEAAEVELEDA